ncbi:KRF1 protein, partial [Tachuris rubrigastra]|nr:KRF1 protein [Tachuris rubrigastra]
MSCYTPCLPCQPCGPTPLANSCNEPCVRQCQDSTVVIQPSPVVVTAAYWELSFILSCDGVPINSGGFDLSCITNRYRCRPC